ncbi:MAG: transporter substrate-binding domain-containing protein [Clostridia bacterium]|nr:transporter substrate-binding domain-containing protein [Clostridia bacterium]
MKNLKKIIAVILLVALAVGLCACAKQEEPAANTAAETKKVLRVGMECNYAPFNWTQTEPSAYTVPIEGGMGYADGYDVQIAKKVAESMGMELVIVKTEWDGLPMGVVSGKLDAIIAGMSPTEDRKATLDFSDAYYTSELVVVVKKDSPYASAKTLADLSGATITGQLNTFHYSVIPQIPGVKQSLALDTFPAMIVATQSGTVDGYVAEKPGAEADCIANPDLTYIVFEQGQGFVASEADVSIAVGLKKGSPLTGDINAALAQIPQAEREQMMNDAKVRQPLAE